MIDGDNLLDRPILSSPAKRTASSWKRALNAVIDWIVWRLLYTLVWEGYFFITGEPLRGAFITLTVLLTLYVMYYLLLETYTGRTVGKWITGTAVVNEKGERPDLSTVMLRIIIRFIPFDFSSFFGNRRGWHDAWSDTYVIDLKK